MLDLWYSEKWSEETKFSIKVKEHLYSEQTPFQKIDFFISNEYGRFFTLDGLIMITEKDEFSYHEMITHVPMCSNLNIKKVLVIGGGDGGTVRELTKYLSIERIDMVEIDERVVRLSQKYLPFTAEKLNDKRVTLYFEDGLKFVANCKEKEYDLILVDSTDPISVGEGLFTQEFYKDCFRILTGMTQDGWQELILIKPSSLFLEHTPKAQIVLESSISPIMKLALKKLIA